MYIHASAWAASAIAFTVRFSHGIVVWNANMRDCTEADRSPKSPRVAS